jgi:N-formylglutamate amidohydrolase
MYCRIITALLLFSFAPGISFAYDAASLVVSSKGTLPLILTVPHDGAESLGSLPVRKNGTIARDAGARALAERVASILEGRLGKRPYLVIARFSRKYLDANRAQQDAMESEDALPAYKAYHDQITAYVSEIKRSFPLGSLLVDVHGQSDDPNTTFRGTRSGLTAKALITRFGPASLQGENSITGILAAKGYAVNPAVGAETLQEDPRFNGGLTVFNYGSQRSDGIDAIQLEFGKNHRTNPRLAEDFAQALIVFMTQYELLPK